jgi:hypothetical protein
MAKGRATAIVLDAVAKRELMSLTRKHGAPQALAERARIILAAASGLYDEPRPGAPREIGDDTIAATVRKTLETLPKGATHWSLRTMAKEIGHAPSTVHRIWRAFGLQPHRW